MCSSRHALQQAGAPAAMRPNRRALQQQLKSRGRVMCSSRHALQQARAPAGRRSGSHAPQQASAPAATKKSSRQALQQPCAQAGERFIASASYHPIALHGRSLAPSLATIDGPNGAGETWARAGTRSSRQALQQPCAPTGERSSSN